MQLDYERSDGKRVDRLVNPLGLVAKGSVWYLVAAADKGIRSYRISRVHHAAITDTPCIRPVGFNLAEYWQRSLVEFKIALPRYAVMVRVAPETLPRLHYAGYFARIVTDRATGCRGLNSCLNSFDVEEAACAYVLGFGAQIEIVEPLELRDLVLQIAKETIAFYTER